MEVQSLNSNVQSGAVATFANQQQTARPPERNEVARQREQEDTESRVGDRVTLSSAARQPTNQQNPTLQRTEQTDRNTEVRPSNSTERAPRLAENNNPQQAQAGNRPPPQPQSVARALEAYTQTSLV